jgi:superfamily II DNA or RNA helicase
VSESYFRVAPAHIEGNPNLREPQIQAYMAIKEYFEGGGNQPALAVLPTGTGKTGLIAIVPYGIAEKRVLVIAPRVVIKQGIMDNFDNRNLDNFWTKRRVILNPRNLPSIVEYDGSIKLEHMESANFVISTIQMTQWSNPNSLLRKVPPDFFDMIIIDEAHHSPAQTWVEVEEYFAGAKVVKVTGTPFRSDDEEIYAHPVFNYPLGRAMANKYVKRMMKRTYLPDELTFQIADETGELKTVSYDEIRELREDDWVSRQVAYSPECNRLIVDKSLEILRQKRETTQREHKIIAVAMTIDHAESVKLLYDQAGAPAAIVSSRKSAEENEQILVDFANDRYQVIVNVGMLGEGYDNPLISVAAVFRPFRTLLPYAQFAGRALRDIPGGTDVDNTAHLVYHRALGIEALWDYYRAEEQRADIIDHLRAAEKALATGEGDEHESGPDESVTVIQAGGVDVDAASFLDDIDIVKAYEDALAEASVEADRAVDHLRKGGFDVTDEMLQAILAAQQSDYLAKKRPDLDYKERRRRLNRTIQDGVAEILTKHGWNAKANPRTCGLPPQLQHAWALAKASKLDGYLVLLINARLRDKIGGGREDWTTADYARAQPMAEELLANLAVVMKRGGE